MHYREWFELLDSSGHEIAGKDPLAVFLTQISRSPGRAQGARARASTSSTARRRTRLRHTLDALHAELRDLTATGTDDLAVIRARRSQLTTEIGRAERALEEVGALLGPRRAALAAAG